MRDVERQVIAIIARQAVLDPAQVTRAMTSGDLGLDSLGVVEMIFAIEETFDISIPFNANEPVASSFDLSSVGAVVDAVQALIDRRG